MCLRLKIQLFPLLFNYKIGSFGFFLQKTGTNALLATLPSSTQFINCGAPIFANKVSEGGLLAAHYYSVPYILSPASPNPGTI